MDLSIKNFNLDFSGTKTKFLFPGVGATYKLSVLLYKTPSGIIYRELSFRILSKTKNITSINNSRNPTLAQGY